MIVNLNLKDNFSFYLMKSDSHDLNEPVDSGCLRMIVACLRIFCFLF